MRDSELGTSGIYKFTRFRVGGGPGSETKMARVPACRAVEPSDEVLLYLVTPDLQVRPPA